MATQTTIQQQLPPGYVTGIGEQFSDFFMGNMPANTTDITKSPFYADPNQMFGGSFNPSTGQFTGITGANVPASDFLLPVKMHYKQMHRLSQQEHKKHLQEVLDNINNM